MPPARCDVPKEKFAHRTPGQSTRKIESDDRQCQQGKQPPPPANPLTSRFDDTPFREIASTLRAGTTWVSADAVATPRTRWELGTSTSSNQEAQNQHTRQDNHQQPEHDREHGQLLTDIRVITHSLRKPPACVPQGSQYSPDLFRGGIQTSRPSWAPCTRCARSSRASSDM